MRISILFAALCASWCGSVAALDRPRPGDMLNIAPGASFETIPPGFADFACGTNGGPPGRALASFSDYASCPAEPSGWHEVYFRYDDELEYWAKANNEPLLEAWTGTRVFNFPVIASVLIADDGVLAGLRLTSDPRDLSIPRDSARFLFPFLLSHFKPSTGSWSCTELPAGPDESDVGGEFWKEDCTYSSDGLTYDLRVRYLRSKGEHQIDPHSGLMTDGQFESSVRFELRLAD